MVNTMDVMVPSLSPAHLHPASSSFPLSILKCACWRGSSRPEQRADSWAYRAGWTELCVECNLALGWQLSEPCQPGPMHVTTELWF